MNRTEFVAHIASTQGITKAEAEKAIATFIGGVKSAVAGGQNVQLVGFGAFEVQHKEAHVGRNPLNGESIQIAAKNAVKFKVGEGLKAAANGK